MTEVDNIDSKDTGLDIGKFFFHCIKCKQKLSCPKNTLIIECPLCNEIIMPYSEYVISCIECNKKLHYPPCAQVIRCSNKLCRCLMDVSTNPIQKCKLSVHGNITRIDTLSSQKLNPHS